MGILDDIKPQGRKPSATELTVDRTSLFITWSDGRRSELPLRFVRERCPCAGCVEEWTGRRTVDVAAIPADIRPLQIDPVGRYAVRVSWSDGHSTGIYSWDVLRALDEELAGRKEKS
jgi:DUF971 family protein